MSSMTCLCHKCMIIKFSGYFICAISADLYQIVKFSYPQLLVSTSAQKLLWCLKLTELQQFDNIQHVIETLTVLHCLICLKWHITHRF